MKFSEKAIIMILMSILNRFPKNKLILTDIGLSMTEFKFAKKYKNGRDL